MSRKPQHKPLSFSTTMRNPERMAGFLNCVKPFEGMILTNKIIEEIVKKVIKEKLYTPVYVNRTPELNRILKDEDSTYSNDQIIEIIQNSPQNHKEAGFDHGWPSRFDTWYKLNKEFGFMYYEMNKKIEISTCGHMLCDAYESDEENKGQKIQNVFLNALMKYQTNNPFRKNANENTPVILLLRVIKLLKEKNGKDDPGISRKEIPFLTCWPDNDFLKLYQYILDFRKIYGFTASSEVVYEKCLELLQTENRKRFKFNQIINEGVDDFIRKLRITGIISLRGLGRFIDFNMVEINKINYIIDNYSDYKTFSDEYEYYKYMGEIDSNIMTIEVDTTFDLEALRVEALNKWSKHYDKEIVLKELERLSKRTATRDEFLKNIEEPTRLEFLTSISLKQQFPNIDIYPNYSVDDEGNPTFTARGGLADIEIFDEESDSLFEVTLMTSRNQATNEIPAITRHLGELQDKTDKKTFSVFLAPVLHKDSRYMIDFTKHQYGLDIVGLNIEDYIELIPTLETTLDFLTSKN